MAPTTPNTNVPELWPTGTNAAPTSYGGRLNAYCGMGTYAVRSVIFTCAAGGHGDYLGNEIVTLDLKDDAPIWVLHHPGSDGRQVINTNLAEYPSESQDLTRYRDDLPASRHTYMGTVAIERHHRYVTTGGSMSLPGTMYQDIEAFDADVAAGVNGWDDRYAYPGSQGGVGGASATGAAIIGPSTCKDPRTEVIYTWSAGRMHMVTPSVAGPQAGVAGSGGTYSYAGLGVDPYQREEGATCVDTTRGKVFWTHGSDLDSKTRPYTFDIATNTLDARHTYSGSAAAALETVHASCGAVYVPEIDRYLIRGRAAGGAVYSVNPASWDVTALPTTGGDTVGNVIPQQVGSGATGGAADPIGVYNKWARVPQLGGVVYVPGAEHDVWFLRVA